MPAAPSPPPVPTTPAETLVQRQARRESSVRSYPRRLPVALVRGAGSTVWDEHGSAYLDCLAGAGALALGHHHPVVTEALQRAISSEVPLSTLDLTTPWKDAFTTELLGSLPEPLASGRIQFCGPTGADAVEAALKLCRTATGRQPIIAFGGGYHGMTAGALAATSTNAVKERVQPLLPGVHHLPFPTSWRGPYGTDADTNARTCAQTLRWLLTDDHSGVPTPAAVLFEPVQGEGGVHPAPPAFAAEVAAACRAAGVPIILDEVQTGLGRTGTLWGMEALGIVPDVVVASKAIGGGLPLAVLVHRKELDVFAPGAHSGTFRGNQLAMATGAATIAEVRRAGLAERAATLGDRLLADLRRALADHPHVGDVRGRGLMIGIEVVDPEHLDDHGLAVADGALARAVQTELLARGIIVEVGGRHGAVVRLLPPLVLTDAEADRVVATLADALGTLRPLQVTR